MKRRLATAKRRDRTGLSSPRCELRNHPLRGRAFVFLRYSVLNSYFFDAVRLAPWLVCLLRECVQYLLFCAGWWSLNPKTRPDANKKRRDRMPQSNLELWNGTERRHASCLHDVCRLRRAEAHVSALARLCLKLLLVSMCSTASAQQVQLYYLNDLIRSLPSHRSSCARQIYGSVEMQRVPRGSITVRRGVSDTRHIQAESPRG